MTLNEQVTFPENDTKTSSWEFLFPCSLKCPSYFKVNDETHMTLKLKDRTSESTYACLFNRFILHHYQK